MAENVYICKCGEGIHDYNSWDMKFFESRKMCEKCYVKAKGLIKSGNHYVPWDYRNNAEISGDEPGNPEYYEDVNASLPKISWDEEHRLWKITFSGPDIGGYDAITFVWYYKSKEDILKDMEKRR